MDKLIDYVKPLLLVLCLSLLTNCKKKDSTESQIKFLQAKDGKADNFIVAKGKNISELADLFHYHKQWLVNESLTFDILGWGPKTTGSYLILKSDKLANRFFSISGERTGKVINSFITDMDADMQEEVLIILRENTKGKANLVIHEIDSLNKQKIIYLPELSEDLTEGYYGTDSFYINNNKIIREFPVYEGQQSLKQPRGKRSIEYILSNNTLVLSGNREAK